MPLTGKQQKALQEALLGAFPDRGSLAQMMRQELDEHLDNIADGRTLAEVVFNLIEWAEVRGKLDALLAGARAANPDNPALRAVAESLDVQPIARPAAPAWPAGARLIDAAALAEAAAQAAAADPATDSLYTRLGTAALWHIAAGQDVRRELTDRVLAAISALGDRPGMRFALVRAKGGNGKTTFLRRLAYELAGAGALVLLAREGQQIDYDALRAACAAAGGRVYLLLDDAYRQHTALLAALDTFTIPNLTVLATSRFYEVPPAAPQPGLALLPGAGSDLDDLTAAEAAQLLDRVRACGALRAAHPEAVLESARQGQEPLLVAVARLTHRGGLETYVRGHLAEMNRRRDPVGQEPEDWTSFLQVFYAIAICHALGAHTPQAVLPALTGLPARRVLAQLCDPATGEPTEKAREYLRGTCGTTWRTDHELIAVRTVRYLAGPGETPLARFAALLARLAPENGPAPLADAAVLAGTLLRRYADTPDLLFPDAPALPGLDPLAPIQDSFTVPDAPRSPAQSALLLELTRPALAAPLARLQAVAPAAVLATVYAPAYLRVCHWDAVLQVTTAALRDPTLPPIVVKDALVCQAIAARHRADYAAALAGYAHLLAQWPDDANIIRGRGNTYYAMARYAEALADYDRSLALRGDDPDFLVARGLAWYRLEHYAEALADYTRSLEMRPDQPDTWNGRAEVFYRLGRYAEALADYTRSLEIRPDHPATLADRGTTYSALEQPLAALADLDRSLAGRPDDPATLTSRANAYSALARYPEALADYDRSLALRPDDPLTLANRAHVYATLGRYPEALADNDRSLALQPDDAATLFNRAFVYMKLDRHAEALADLDRSLALRPDDLPALANRATTYSILGRHAEALTDLDRSLALAPDDPATLASRAVVYYAQGRYAEALADLDRSLAGRPAAAALSDRGATATRLGRYSDALADFTHSLALEPGRAETLYNLACLHSLRGDRPAALDALAGAIAADPGYRRSAGADPDFAALRDDPAFGALVAPPPTEPRR